MKSAAIDTVRELRRQGYQALLAGGCVRDILLGREPIDYDVATDATPDDVMRIFPQTYAVGAQFGVVLVPFTESELRAYRVGLWKDAHDVVGSGVSGDVVDDRFAAEQDVAHAS